MIGEFVLNTGLSVSGDLFAQTASLSFQNIVVKSNTGLETLSSLNSQTLLQGTPEVDNIGGTTVITQTGYEDFYITGYAVKAPLTGLKSKYFLYDKAQNNNVVSVTNKDTGILQSGIMSGISVQNSGAQFQPLLFLNGQKLYEGIDYENRNGTFEWINDFNVSGKMFYYEKPENLTGFWGSGLYAVTGVPFNKGTTAFYYNGLRQPAKVFLESSSVIPIDTGKSSAIFFEETVETTMTF